MTAISQVQSIWCMRAQSACKGELLNVIMCIAHDIRRDKDMNDKIKDVSVSQRQIYILSLLSQNPKGYLAEEIRERLHRWDIDVTKRTILRDID